MQVLLKSVRLLLKSFVIAGVAFSGCAGCRVAPPRQTLCMLDVSSPDPQAWVSYCFDTAKDDNGFDLPVARMDKYICRSPEDEQVLEEWIKRVLQKADKNAAAFIKDQPLPITRFLQLPGGTR